MEPRVWLSYPDHQPETSSKGSKKFYYVQMKCSYYEGCAVKCYFNEYWLRDSLQTSISDAVSFTDAPSNGKHEIAIGEPNETTI